MKDYRLKQKLGSTIKHKNVSIQRGIFILNFDWIEEKKYYTYIIRWQNIKIQLYIN